LLATLHWPFQLWWKRWYHWEKPQMMKLFCEAETRWSNWLTLVDFLSSSMHFMMFTI
jgi:hypothetical protein